jgi:hypothetical protein
MDILQVNISDEFDLDLSMTFLNSTTRSKSTLLVTTLNQFLFMGSLSNCTGTLSTSIPQDEFDLDLFMTFLNSTTRSRSTYLVTTINQFLFMGSLSNWTGTFSKSISRMSSTLTFP